VCECKNIEIGSYKNQVTMKAPNWSLHEFICVDRCLLNEIKYLWNIGIITTGCCCGHNKLQGYIGVEFKFIPKMKELGYKVAYNFCRPNDEDSFKPKSI